MDRLEARLRQLEDVEEIRRLQLEYRRCLDGGDFQGFAALFTEDGEWEGGNGHERGPNAIRAMLERTQSAANRDQVHLIANQVVLPNGDTATAESTFAVVERHPDGSPSLYMVGTYRDELVRTDHGWRFRRRLALTHSRTR
jgi:uncharacterized protein (TIGR02246 family)